MKLYLRLVFTVIQLITLLMPKGNPQGYWTKKTKKTPKKPRIKKKK